jgi:hypothetical protein
MADGVWLKLREESGKRILLHVSGVVIEEIGEIHSTPPSFTLAMTGTAIASGAVALVSFQALPDRCKITHPGSDPRIVLADFDTLALALGVLDFA